MTVLPTVYEDDEMEFTKELSAKMHSKAEKDERDNWFDANDSLEDII